MIDEHEENQREMERQRQIERETQENRIQELNEELKKIREEKVREDEDFISIVFLGKSSRKRLFNVIPMVFVVVLNF